MTCGVPATTTVTVASTLKEFDSFILDPAPALSRQSREEEAPEWLKAKLLEEEEEEEEEQQQQHQHHHHQPKPLPVPESDSDSE